MDHLEAFAWARLYDSTQPVRRCSQVEKALTKNGVDAVVVKRVMSRLTRTGEACWAQIIQRCADYRARVFGYYAPTRHQVEMNELWVAGPDSSAVDVAMLQRLAEKIRERKALCAAIERGRN